jgi:putative addiction module component (TIGR02574 family)
MAMSSVDDAFLAAESLAPAEKLRLISLLWESIPPADWRPSDSDLAEVKRRWAEYEAGRVELISWEEVRDEARERLSRHHD